MAESAGLSSIAIIDQSPLRRLGPSSPRHGRHPIHPGNHQSGEGIQGLRRGERCQSARAARPDPCADRPQRRRQDDGVQPAHQVPDPDARQDPLQRPRHHHREAGTGGAARHGAFVPDLGHLSAHDGDGERAHRAAACAGHLVPLLEAGQLAGRAQRPRDGTAAHGGPDRIRRHADGGTALRPQARAGDRHHAWPPSRR